MKYDMDRSESRLWISPRLGEISGRLRYLRLHNRGLAAVRAISLGITILLEMGKNFTAKDFMKQLKYHLRLSVRQHLFLNQSNSLHTRRKNFSLVQRKVLPDGRTKG